MKKGKKAIVWFRNDLRIHDNEALTDALLHAETVIPVYVFDERIFGGKTRFDFKKIEIHRAKFIIESVNNLRQNLLKHGSNLIVRVGKPEDVITEIAQHEKSRWVYCNRERTKEEVLVQDTLEENLWSVGQEVRYSRGKMLYYTSDLPFPVTHTPDVFTVFRKEVEKITPIREPLEIPEMKASFSSTLDPASIPELEYWFSSDELETKLSFKGGEDEALEQLQYYFSDQKLASQYFDTRNDSLGRNFSTKFSPYLSSGCLSPKMAYKMLKKYEAEFGANKSTYWIYFELLWRDFFRLMGKKYKEKIFLVGGIQSKIKHRPSIEKEKFSAWKEARTGYPIIDANMRELKTTGFISNRGRQNVASFLVHDLNVNWQIGASYFESMLVDYDPCSNYGNWNYIAGIGNDPRAYRKFNVVMQSKKYDPDANYIKTWLPELAKLETKYIHFPSEASEEDLLKAGINLGEDYPFPIVENLKSLSV